MKIFILLGHTDPNTLTGEMANRYEAAARAGGHEVRRLNIGEMHFDPILHEGYKAIQQLEPDLEDFRENVRWCDHFVIVYPIWWSEMPANLKGLFDRAWLPAFAFKFTNGGYAWKRLLKGRTARIIATSRTTPWLLAFMYGSATAPLALAILQFAGLRTRVTRFGPAESASDHTRARWLRKVEKLGKRGK